MLLPTGAAALNTSFHPSSRVYSCASLPILEDSWPWPTGQEAGLGVESPGGDSWVTYSWHWSYMVNT